MITFNTTDGMTTKPNDNPSGDPWHHLPVDEWIQKQVEWGEAHVSGSGLVAVLKERYKGTPLVGAEIGVCLGVTSEYLLNYAPDVIGQIYAVDNYPSYIDWNGLDISTIRQDKFKENARQRLDKFAPKVRFCYQNSQNFAEYLSKNQIELDFIFVDADHSYMGALADFKRFWPLIKEGGVFAGHDYGIGSVRQALQEFLGDKFTKVFPLINDAWFIIKE